MGRVSGSEEGNDCCIILYAHPATRLRRCKPSEKGKENRSGMYGIARIAPRTGACCVLEVQCFAPGMHDSRPKTGTEKRYGQELRSTIQFSSHLILQQAADISFAQCGPVHGKMPKFVVEWPPEVREHALQKLVVAPRLLWL